MSSQLLTNIHEVICENLISSQNIYLVSGNYEYYHYLCDGFDDRGWGCGYRTLQTICSWINNNYYKTCKVPSITEIQEILVNIEDKPVSFIGSRQWIGSFEVCLVLDKLYDIQCRILHVNKGHELNSLVDVLIQHFQSSISPIMMGGDIDCSSKGVMGIRVANGEASLLIVDPHFVGKGKSKEYLQTNGWVKWQPLKEFLNSSFYNLCLPLIQRKSDENKTTL